nr:hypothetical protein [Tanacetum cinerariifolium]
MKIKIVKLFGDAVTMERVLVQVTGSGAKGVGSRSVLPRYLNPSDSPLRYLNRNHHTGSSDSEVASGDDVFERFAVTKTESLLSKRVSYSDSSNAKRIWPSIVSDGNECLSLFIELPGVREEDVKVFVQHHTIVIEGQGDEKFIADNGFNKFICWVDVDMGIYRISDIKADIRRSSELLQLTIPKLKQEEVRALDVKDEIVPFDKQSDDLKKKLAKIMKLKWNRYALSFNANCKPIKVNPWSIKGSLRQSLRVIDGVVHHVAPTTAEQRLARKNELKAPNTLLMALPDKHQLKFNIHKDAKTLMEAIEKLFGGNKETKKVQKTLVKQQYKNFNGSSFESPNQIHDRLQNLISQLEILGETLSQKDINLNTTEAVSVVASVTAASAKVPVFALPNVDTLSDVVIYSFFASQSNSPQLDNDDLKGIDADDLEKMDLKWQMAMLTMRARRFLQRIGRNLGANETTSIGFDMSKVECYNCHREGTLQGSASHLRTQGGIVMVLETIIGAFRQKKNQPTMPSWHSPPQVLQVLTMRDNALVELRKKFEKAEQERDELKLKLEKFQTFSKNLSQLLASQTNDKTRLGYDNQVFDSSIFNCAEMFSSESDVSMPASPVYDRSSAPIIEDWVSNSEDESEAEPIHNAYSFVQPPEHLKTPRPSVKPVEHHISADKLRQAIPKSRGHRNSRNKKACFVCKSLTHLIKDCYYYEKQMVQQPVRNHAQRGNHQDYARMTHPNPHRHVVPIAVLTRFRLVPLTAARPVTTAVPQPNVISPRPAKTIVTNSHSPPRRTIILRPSPAHRNMSRLSDFEAINGGYVAFGENPKGGKITGKGKIKTGKLDFDDVYFVKELKFNIFSVLQMCDKKNNVLFTDTKCIVLSFDFKLPDKNHVLLRVLRENNMYNIDLKNIVPTGDLTCLFAKETLDESNLWHRRLGHINFKIMNKLVKGNLVRELPSNVFENNQTCVACKKGKQHRAFCKSKPVSSISQPLQMLHMDLFGPTFVKSLNKKSYCLVVTDDYSGFSWVFFLATKNETSPILNTFITGIENQLSLKVKIIRSDNETKFKNQDLNQFCGMKGIKREFSVARTLQQNDIAKRKSRTLIKAARTMLADSLLPIPFWAGAVNTACYVQNRALVTKPHNKTLYELLLGRTPSIGFMRPFGCLVAILNTLDPLGKFNGKADEGFLVGCSNTNEDTTFEIKEPESEVHVSPSSSAKTKKHDDKTKREAKGKSPIEMSTGVRNLSEEFEDFTDNSTNEVNAASTPVTAVEPNSTNSTNTFSAAGPSNTGVSLNFEIGGKSSFVDPSQYPNDTNMPALEDITYSDDEKDVGAEADFFNLETTITVNQGGLSQINNDDFHTSMFACFLSQEEPKRVHQALKDPSWIEAMQEELLQFKMKKVWVLVDLPNSKRAIDYEEAFSPVARIEAIRLFLAYASFMGFMVYQMDVKNAFLYETIEVEVYICQPLGFEDLDYPDKVYKVVKALYGLHQAPRAWYETMANYLLENGFQRGKIDQTLFIKMQKGDILLVQKSDGIFISHDKYVAEILRKFGLTDRKSASTPIDTEKPLLKDPDGEDVDVHTYSDYARASLDRKSTTGGCQFLSCRLISWQCKKQTVVATSSTNADPDQTVSGKDSSNSLMADNLPKIVWYSAHHVALMKSWLVQKQMAIGVNTPRCDEDNGIDGFLNASEGFDQILDFLNASAIQYALTVNPNIYVSCIKQFWSSVLVKKTNDVVQLQDLIDRRKVIITEDSVRQALRLDDAESRKFNFLKYIFDSLVRNVDSSFKFYMYPRFLQLMIRTQVGDLSFRTNKYSSPALTQKVFANMRRVGKGFSGVDTPLFEGMLVPQQAVDDVVADDIGAVAADDVANVVADVIAHAAKPTPPLPTPATTSPHPQKLIPSTSHVAPTPPPSPIAQPSTPPPQQQPSHNAAISMDYSTPCEASGLKRLKKVRTAQRIESSADTIMDDREDASKQGGKIAKLDADKDVTLEEVVAEDAKDTNVQGRLEESQAQVYHIDLEHADKVLSMQDDEPEPAELKEVMKVVTTAASIITAAPSAARRRKGAVIRDPEKTATPLTIVHSEPKSKDKGKGILVEEPKPLKKQAQIEQDEAHAREGMSYDDIRPIFKKHFNYVVGFLEISEERLEEEASKALKRKSESSKQQAPKKQKLDDEVEELKKHLQIIPNDEDDVYTEATPLALKVLIVDYQIHTENNKPYYKIIRADGTHQLFLSFLSLLRNFDREDLEMLWKIVQEIFASLKPKNLSDDFLLNILKAMFEKPDVEAQVWKNQKGSYGLAKFKSWKLLESCGVHIVTFTTTQMILLIERRYPLTRFTLEQMLNNVRLEVEEESEVSLELLRFTYNCWCKLMMLDSAADSRLRLLEESVVADEMMKK